MNNIYAKVFTMVWFTVWFVIALCIAESRNIGIHEISLSSTGDFLAGISAPIAFLWFYLGYMQQGEELKNNTKALLLQHEELKQTVLEYKKMVQYQEVQFEPNFQLTVPNVNIGTTFFDVKIKNRGKDAFNLKVESDQNKLIKDIDNQIPSILKEETKTSYCRVVLNEELAKETEDIQISLRYDTPIQKQLLKKYSISFSEEYSGSETMTANIDTII